MTGTREPDEEPGETGWPGSGIRGRNGLRITLLCLATLILALGATVAATFGYATLTHG
jgi:hypothetical protein